MAHLASFRACCAHPGPNGGLLHSVIDAVRRSYATTQFLQRPACVGDLPSTPAYLARPPRQKLDSAEADSLFSPYRAPLAATGSGTHSSWFLKHIRYTGRYRQQRVGVLRSLTALASSFAPIRTQTGSAGREDWLPSDPLNKVSHPTCQPNFSIGLGLKLSDVLIRLPTEPSGAPWWSSRRLTQIAGSPTDPDHHPPPRCVGKNIRNSSEMLGPGTSLSIRGITAAHCPRHHRTH